MSSSFSNHQPLLPHQKSSLGRTLRLNRRSPNFCFQFKVMVLLKEDFAQLALFLALRPLPWSMIPDFTQSPTLKAGWNTQLLIQYMSMLLFSSSCNQSWMNSMLVRAWWSRENYTRQSVRTIIITAEVLLGLVPHSMDMLLKCMVHAKKLWGICLNFLGTKVLKDLLQFSRLGSSEYVNSLFSFLI